MLKQLLVSWEYARRVGDLLVFAESFRYGLCVEVRD